MWTRAFIFLIGVLFMYEAISEDIYVSELMVESNVTLDAETVLSSWATPQDLILTVSGQPQTVTLVSRKLIAECLVIGDDYNCSCSSNYHWSNEVCYNFKCCSDAPCATNVSFVTPICVPKSNVTINGSIYTSSSWISSDDELTTFATLNGVTVNATITSKRTSPDNSYITEFEAAVNVRLNTSKLQEIIDNLKATLGAGAIYVDTRGMVTLWGPNGTVNYGSEQKLNCTFEEATGSAGWNLSTEYQRYELNNGLLVALDTNCATEEFESCVGVTLRKVTGIWEGTYECGFTVGTVRHTARTELHVALLPDQINIIVNPFTVDCSTKNSAPTVRATAQIPNTNRIYTYWWTYNQKSKLTVNGTSEYTEIIPVNCSNNQQPYKVGIVFKNEVGQEKNASVDIPVIYAGAKFCPEEIVDGQMWPKTPAEATVVNQSCPMDRVGYTSRTCLKNFTWLPVFPNCVSSDLKNVTNAAGYFLNGLGATNSVAKDIFQGITNSSLSSTGSDQNVADIGASISIIDTMAMASENITLQEEVFPQFVDAASNMLNSNWTGVNDTILHKMSSTYLSSVENLVKNINNNQSSGFNSTNLDLRFCSSVSCNVSAFNISVNLNMTSGTMKVVAVKNLMNKLNNEFLQTQSTSLLLSATLVNSTDSEIGIKLAFPKEELSTSKRYCVFWDTEKGDWSDIGCIVNTTDENNTVCECNHMTSFSVLMAKTNMINDISTPDLDILTKVGLYLSVCSLIIFLFIEFLVWPAVIKTNLSHFRHTAVVNIAVFRLLADCSFLASSSPEQLSNSMCLTFTVCKHLFYLAMFTWMLCLSVMLVHQLIFVFSPLRKRVFMFLSSILGYICPLVLVATSYVYYKYTEMDYYDRTSCWLTYKSLLVGSIHAFLLPVGTIVLINLFSMVVVIITLMKTSVPDSSKANDKEAAKSILKVVILLTPVFGVTWIIGFFLLLLDKNNPMFMVANYSFTILNSFQGVFILITGCLAEQKVRDELIRIIKEKSGRGDDSTNKSVSTAYTKYK
ncbi:adhesion G protein-coupled receptor F4 isoform X2 [Melanotaenia boesemani]|uniref:adhesion G protein-coupled receptor F4 isoform X2 n=1 Tax=Melanotaenia boesemani TaxID=1250792 RepID=UPI001C04B12E|nr:adhesion G protein-coupled receptor F4 isoform X2 [Melanotaenia boesemani]